MAKLFRIEFSGAAYRVMPRAHGRQDTVRDDRDRQRGRHTEIRSVAAWLAKHHRQATLRVFTEPFEPGRPRSVGNLTRRTDLALSKSRKLRRTIETIEAKTTDLLAKKKNRCDPIIAQETKNKV